MKIKVIIMAGGKGERFWPYSRIDRPKQFLSIVGKKTLLQQTVSRASRLAELKDIYIITGREYVKIVKEQIGNLPDDNIIAEPVGRDTAPCIGLGYTYLKNERDDTVMVVLPADHLVTNEDQFCIVIERAAEAAYMQKKLVTIGLKPSRPETGYGYIRYGAEIKSIPGVYEVLKFTEKPDLETALSFLQSGDYLWNSGMFIWRLDVIREAYRKFLPDVYMGLEKVAEAMETEEEKKILQEVFPTLPRISVDYGIMEKSKETLVVPASFGWDDLGSWTSLERVDKPDSDGNIFEGNVLSMDTKNSIIRSNNQEKLIATLGIEDVIVVDTEDVLLVADKARTSDLKNLIEELKERGLQRYLTSNAKSGRELTAQGEDSRENLLAQLISRALENNKEDLKQVDKPWGREIWWSVTEHYVGKFIEVNTGHSLSLQYHRKKRETMLFIKGAGILELDSRKLEITSGLIVDIFPGMIHRVTAKSDVSFIEISTSETDDLVRLEDNYGRV